MTSYKVEVVDIVDGMCWEIGCFTEIDNKKNAIEKAKDQLSDTEYHVEGELRVRVYNEKDNVIVWDKGRNS